MDEQEGRQNEEKQPEPEEVNEEVKEQTKEEKKNAQVMTKTDMNKLKQKNYSTRNQRNETVFCADCNKYMSKHNYRYNHRCKPLQEKKQQKAKADIMKQIKEELRAQDRKGEVCHNQRREEHPKEGEIKRLASKIL